jgi:hypothetical protein
VVRRVADFCRAAQRVACDLADLAPRVLHRRYPARAVAGVLDRADVRAGLCQYFAEGVVGVLGGYAFGVGQLRELVQRVPRLGGGGVVCKGGGGGAAQAVQFFSSINYINAFSEKVQPRAINSV